MNKKEKIIKHITTISNNGFSYCKCGLLNYYIRNEHLIVKDKMKVEIIALKTIFISPHNVRKTLDSENEEEGSISDLANDIMVNGLINPITVRKSEQNKFEVIAGQRRLLAFKHLSAFHPKYTMIPCNIIDVNDQKAEELSLVENVQRNQMTTTDKVSAYSKLYDVYHGDINKVASIIHISKWTVKKYIQVRHLPEEILSKMDSNKEDKITIDVAVELSKLPSEIDIPSICNNIQQLTSTQKINAIKEFIRQEKHFADDIVDIAQDITIQCNKIKLSPSVPYVYDEETDEFIIIPTYLYKKVILLIQSSKDNKTM